MTGDLQTPDLSRRHIRPDVKFGVGKQKQKNGDKNLTVATVWGSLIRFLFVCFGDNPQPQHKKRELSPKKRLVKKKKK